MNILNSTYLKSVLLLLAVGLHQSISINATEAQQTVTSVLEEFDRANASRQREIAIRFFDLLNDDQFFDEPYSLPPQWPVDSIRAEVWYCAGQYYFINQDYSKGIAYTNKALPLLREGKDTEKTADCISYLSSCYFRISDYANAIKYGKEVEEIDRKTGDKSVISSDLSNIAAIYLAAKRPEEALPFAIKAIKNSTEAGDSLRMGIQMGIASEIYQSLHEYEKALEYATNAYRIDLRQGRSGKVAIRLCQMAAPLIAMKQYKKAEAYLTEAVPQLKESGNKQSYSIAYNQLGSIALAKDDRQKAAEYFNQALPFFTEQGDVFNEIKTQEGLYKALKEVDPLQAMKHLERFSLLKDSLYQHEMEEAISEHNAKYKNEELRLKYEYEGKVRNTLSWISALIILLAVGIIILLLYINHQRKQKHDIIKQAERMRTHFFTNITHEFRTPLTVIQSAAQEVMRQSPENSDMHRNASDILRHEQGLLNLINQILDIAKISSGEARKDTWKHGDIVEFITVLSESFRSYATHQGIKLIYTPKQEPVEMDFIPDYMQKVVQNLISNAIKFSHPGSQVLVTTQVKGESLQIYVSDEGIGMTAEQTEHIFKPFYQASNDTNNIGTGIGLSLVKLAVENMKGKIEVHSEPDKGTTFIVTLPIRKGKEVPAQVDKIEYMGTDIHAPLPMSEAPILSDDEGTDNEEIRILIIEDTPEVAQYMKRQLNPDYHYYFATNGEAGLRKAEQLVPDLIITDIMMPGMDGFELCKQVRDSELLNHIPVIMVTAKATHEDRLHGLEVGADAYMEKPFHADELNVRVDKLMEQRRLLHEKYAASITKPVEPDDRQPKEVKAEQPLISELDKLFLSKLTDAINEAIGNGKIDYDALASNLCLSRAQLNRKVKSITGYTTTEFILQIRITLAKHLLDSTNATVWEVALDCGMDNYSYFCTLFKKFTGMTPLQYKNRDKDVTSSPDFS